MPRQTKPKDDQKPADAPAEATAEAPAEAEPTLEQYEERRLELLERLEAEIAAHGMPKSLHGKLAMITGLVGQVRKSGRNTFHNYSYAKESDLVEAIRPMISRLRIFVWWSLAADPEKGIVPHQRLSQAVTRGRGENKEIIGETESLTVVSAWFKFIDDDGNMTEPQLMMGYGDDTSDKGLYKALTGMEKYFLFKTFLVSTGDDPEGDPRADQRAAGRDTRNVEVRGRQAGSRQAAPGGRQQDASQPQLKMVGELLGQLDARQAVRAIPIIEELTGTKVAITDPDDIPGAFVAHMQGLEPEVVGKLIYDLRKRVAALPQKSEDSAATTNGTTEAASDAGDTAATGDDAAADEPVDDGTVDPSIV